MHVMVIGKGGREHAMVKQLGLSKSVEAVYVCPGNAGMVDDAKCVDLKGTGQIVEFCKSENIELVVIGPETDLVSGLADDLRSHGIKVFGPEARAANLEGSKIFSKAFMLEYGIPTAKSHTVSSVVDIKRVFSEFTPPYVLKADGLCAGKGVFICKDKEELLKAAKLLFEDKIFQQAGEQALLEQFMPGEELSLFVLTNGSDYQILPLYRDHKRLNDGDHGPNTGGMGVIGPIDISSELLTTLENEIIRPTIAGFKQRDFFYCGVIFIGVMLTENGPSVLEYNVRFGDPETQCLLPSIKEDLGRVFFEIASGRMPKMSFHNEKIACVVMASPGYPEAPAVGEKISGEWTSNSHDQYFLWAGVTAGKDGLATGGGRVANAIGVGSDFRTAIERAYKQAKLVTWPGIQFRKDIGNSV